MAKYILVAWQWMFVVKATDFCPPSPTMLNIGQFVNEAADLQDHMAWMLAYTCALQHVREAAKGQRWCPRGMYFSMQVSHLLDVFVTEIVAEQAELDITSWWGLGAREIPVQKRNSPFTNVITFLDEYMRHQPSSCEWDKFVHPPPLVLNDTPCWGLHLGHILGWIVDIGNSMLVYWFHMTEPDGEFVDVMRGLIFKGHLLAYVPTYNGVEWVPIHGTVSDFNLPKIPWSVS